MSQGPCGLCRRAGAARAVVVIANTTPIDRSASATRAARIRTRVGGTADLSMSDDLLAFTCWAMDARIAAQVPVPTPAAHVKWQGGLTSESRLLEMPADRGERLVDHRGDRRRDLVREEVGVPHEAGCAALVEHLR